MLLTAIILAAQAAAMEIPLQKHGGVYILPVRINGVITLDFILDSGASEVTIPADVFLTLLRTGTIKDEDILPGERYQLADGSTVKSPRFNIRDLEIGGYKITNVVGSIADPRGPLLLGQSFLDKLDSWTLDNRAHTLIIGGPKTEPIKNTETENLKASVSGLEKVPVAQATPTSKPVIQPVPDLPSKYGSLLKAMIDGAKNADGEKINHSKEELQVLSRGQKFHNKEAREKNAAGLEAVSKEQYGDALKHFYDAYLHCPQDVEILNNLGLALIKTGDFDNSEKVLLRALSLAPTRTNAWALLGQVLSIKGDVSGGCACFLNAFRYTRSEKKTTEALQNLAEYDPFPNTQQAARLALSKLGKSPPSPKPVVTIIDNVQAYYLQNIHSGQVLVIKGEVLNESSQSVSSVMVEGKLFDSNDMVAQSQRCYAGNSLADKEIENLTISEISERVNREGLTSPDPLLLPFQAPNTQGKIPCTKIKTVPIVLPAEKAPFMLVFNNLPQVNTLSNYSVNVISAKFDERLPSPASTGNTTSPAMAPKSEASELSEGPGIPGLKWGDSPEKAKDIMVKLGAVDEADVCEGKKVPLNIHWMYFAGSHLKSSCERSKQVNEDNQKYGQYMVFFHGTFLERDARIIMTFYEHELYYVSALFDDDSDNLYSDLLKAMEAKFGRFDETEKKENKRYAQWHGHIIDIYLSAWKANDKLTNEDFMRTAIVYEDRKTRDIVTERVRQYIRNREDAGKE
jgi:tetratricopeptide (TPR) repeat protein